MRLGIFGGTFDPVHLGHLVAAEEVSFRLQLDEVRFVPAHRQPLKAQAPVASDRDRVAMLRLAVADTPRYTIDCQELERPAPSYTVDTLRAVRAREGADAKVFVLVGIDAANTLHQWREPREILRLARVIVMSRSKVCEPDWAVLERIMPDIKGRMDTVTVPDLDIRARDLRARIAAHAPIRYQVPEAVREYIAQHRLYQD